MNNKERAERIRKVISDTSSDPLIKRIKLGTLISEAFSERGIDIILTGGSAVEFYTAGNYMTGDMDFHVRENSQKEEIMRELGFSGQGRNFYLEDAYVEFISTEYMGSKDRALIQKNEFGTLKIIGLEDILLDRIRGAKFWDDATPVYEEWAIALVYDNYDRVDWKYLKENATKTECNDVLKHICNRVLKQRRDTVFEKSALALSLQEGNYAAERDVDLFLKMQEHPFHIPVSEIRKALKEHSPFVKSDLDAYNIERLASSTLPLIKITEKTKKQKAIHRKESYETDIGDSVWNEKGNGIWRCDYPNGYTGLIQRIRGETYTVRFGRTDVSRSKWKDITGKHGIEEAKKWCDMKARRAKKPDAPADGNSGVFGGRKQE